MAWRIKNVNQVDDARIGGAEGHESNLVQNFGCTVLAIAYLCSILGRILYTSGTMPTFSDGSE